MNEGSPPPMGKLEKIILQLRIEQMFGPVDGPVPMYRDNPSPAVLAVMAMAEQQKVQQRTKAAPGVSRKGLSKALVENELKRLARQRYDTHVDPLAPGWKPTIAQRLKLSGWRTIAPYLSEWGCPPDWCENILSNWKP